MSKILEQMSKKDNLEDYFGEEISSLQEEQRTIESNCQENGWNFFHATKYGQMAVVFNVFDKRSEAETEM